MLLTLERCNNENRVIHYFFVSFDIRNEATRYIESLEIDLAEKEWCPFDRNVLRTYFM